MTTSPSEVALHAIEQILAALPQSAAEQTVAQLTQQRNKRGPVGGVFQQIAATQAQRTKMEQAITAAAHYGIRPREDGLVDIVDVDAAFRSDRGKFLSVEKRIALKSQLRHAGAMRGYDLANR